MSIRPIDMQVALRGTQEVAAMRQGELNRQNNQLSNVQSDSNKMREHESASVQQKREVAEAHVGNSTDEGSGGGAYYQSSERKKGEEEKSQEDSENKFPRNKGTHIDIRI